jgi:hypothetical protein
MSKPMGKGVCEKEGVEPVAPAQGSKLGVALSTLGKEPINGLRHNPEKGTNGWYIWCGDSPSEADDFFKPLHIEHIDEYLPIVKKYLELPPGYRFQIDSNNYEDIWFDTELAAS